MYALAVGDCCSSWAVVLLDGVKHKEKNYEDMVSHRSAVRSRDLRNNPDLSASNATWSRIERRWGEGHHLRARPSSSTAGGKTRVSTRATGCPSRLLILFGRQRRCSEFPGPISSSSADACCLCVFFAMASTVNVETAEL